LREVNILVGKILKKDLKGLLRNEIKFMTPQKLITYLKRHYIFVFIFAVLFVLLLRNPYSERNLIANLEPFPDAFYYTTIPRCLLEGQGWKMCRLSNPEIEGVSSAVPPAYSIALLPAYLISTDVRTFYFINVLLAFASLALLYTVSQNFFKSKHISSLIAFFYVTNYFTYWYPSLAMAENLTIPLFLFSILILQQKGITKTISVLAGLTAIGFYATKYSSAPLTASFSVLFILLLLQQKISVKEKSQLIFYAMVPAGILAGFIIDLKKIMAVIWQIFGNNTIRLSENAQINQVNNDFFSSSYFLPHLKEYSKPLFGKPQRFLWDYTPLTEKWIALSGLFGLLASFKNREYSMAKLWLIVATISQLLFISTFYVVDVRYVYHFLPVLLLGFGFFIQFIYKIILTQTKKVKLLQFKNAKLSKIIPGEKFFLYALLLSFLFIYTISNISRLKSAVMINLKYAETPWWYLSQIEMNNYFDTTTTNYDEKPILITLASPFLTDNYSNGNYTTLPLNDQQDFRGNMPEVWGKNDYSDLHKLYENKINEGIPVYITNYGINATRLFEQSFKEIEAKFNLIEVQTGCYNLCNIYRLEFNNIKP
jgi:hypothetical protein